MILLLSRITVPLPVLTLVLPNPQSHLNSPSPYSIRQTLAFNGMMSTTGSTPEKQRRMLPPLPLLHHRLAPALWLTPLILVSSHLRMLLTAGTDPCFPYLQCNISLSPSKSSARRSVTAYAQIPASPVFSILKVVSLLCPALFLHAVASSVVVPSLLSEVVRAEVQC